MPEHRSYKPRLRARARLAATAGLSLTSGLLMLAALPAHAQETSPAPAAAPVQVYEPAFFMRFAPKTAADMVANIPGFDVSEASGDRGFGQARQNVLINGRRVSGKSNDAQSALARIAADTVVRIELVDGASLNIPGLSGQVANVIAHVDTLSGSWNINPELREDLKPSWVRGNVSANGGTDDGWSWSVALNIFEFHNGHKGPGIITDGAGLVTDIRREQFAGHGQEPGVEATLTYEAVDGAVANFNASVETFNFSGREDSFRNPVGVGPIDRFVWVAEDQIEGELGADYEFDLGPGRLKLIGLYGFEDEENQDTVESTPQGGATTGQKFATTEEAGEAILRSEYAFPAFDGDMQWALEGAFNFLDLTSELGTRAPDGSYVLTPLADGTARVEERRAETNLSWSRALTPAINLQSSVGAEYSELTQTGANGLTREFVRPKGFVSLAWRADENLDISVKAERRVGQLDFGDFLSSMDLQNNNQSAGNAELVPEQAWVLSGEYAQKLGPWGAIKFGAEYRLIEDVVDLIPFGVDESAVGNVDEATAWKVSTSGTINFDPVGAKGLQLNFNWFYADSEVDDPLTGVPRRISFTDKAGGVVSLRWDVPDTNWTLVGGVESFQDYAGYRLDQISRSWQTPAITFVSVENKDVMGLRMRLQVVNLNDTSENFARIVYEDGRRTNPINFTEDRRRTFGPIVRFTISDTF